MKKLLYITNSRIPTEKAHGIQIMKMCQAFVSAGSEVELVLPRRKNIINKNPFEYYQVPKSFKIKWVICIDPRILLKLPQGVYTKFQSASFIISLFFYLLFKRNKKDSIFYTREEYLLAVLHLFSRKVVWEGHKLTKNKSLYIKSWQKCKKIIVLTEAMKKEMISFGIEEKKILVAADAVDLDDFTVTVSKSDARRELGFPHDKKIIMYAGHLYGWKGASVLLEAARLLSSPPHEEGQGEVLENMDTMTPSQSPPHEGEKKGVVFVFVGGTDSDIKKFKQKAEELGLLGQDIRGNQSSNSQESVNKSVEIRGQNQWKSEVLILGHKPHQEIPKYLAAADVLVLPTSGKSEIGRSYTSPMKMFEYMAAGKPIVASDIPALREILYDYPRQSTTPSPSVERVGERLKDSSQSAQYGNAILVKPDNPKALAEGIEKVLIDQTLARAIAAQAAEDAKQYTWETRARSILKFILWSYKP